MLWWKLLLTPILIAALTLIGRRWGPRAAGLIVGLPLTTGPVSVFLATEQGTDFAARAATGSILGLACACASVAAFALTLRRKSLRLAITAGLAVAASLSLALGAITLRPHVALGIAALVILLLWSVVRRPLNDASDCVPAPDLTRTAAWDMVARVLIATTMVATVTAAAASLGSRMSGVLSALPILGGLLAVFTYRREGRSASTRLVAAMIIGSMPGLLFFAIVAELLGRASLPVTYGAATAAAILAGSIVSSVTRTPPPEVEWAECLQEAA